VVRPAAADLLALLALLAAIAIACSTTTAPTEPPSRSSTNSGAYPLTITQPDGTTAVIKQRPTRIVTVDNPRISMGTVAALGVAPIGAGSLPLSHFVDARSFRVNEQETYNPPRGGDYHAVVHSPVIQPPNGGSGGDVLAPAPRSGSPLHAGDGDRERPPCDHRLRLGSMLVGW
jgi:hypothetical protein